MPFKSRHTADLLRGRVSVPGATYFLTWVTHNRTPLFADEKRRESARQQVAAIDESGDGSLLAGTVMPDHVHVLFILGTHLSLSAVVAKIRAAITRESSGLKWQLNYFDHQLRPRDSAEDYAFYIFMNPYCAGICPMNRVWTGWIPSKSARWRFQDKLRDGLFPQPEWTEQAGRLGVHLPGGAD